MGPNAQINSVLVKQIEGQNISTVTKKLGILSRRGALPHLWSAVSWKPTLPGSLIGELGLDRNNPEGFRRHLPEEGTDVETVTVDKNRRSTIKNRRQCGRTVFSDIALQCSALGLLVNPGL
jgi:hypothetical protein